MNMYLRIPLANAVYTPDSLFDPQGRIGLDYGVYGVPETFVIDRQGVVRYKHIGALTPEALKTKVEPLLAQLSK